MNQEYLQFKKKKIPPKLNSNKPPKIEDLDDFPMHQMNGFDHDPRESNFISELEEYEDTHLFPNASKKDAGSFIPDPIKIDTVKLNSSQKIQIHGVTVYFPYQPYPCQVTYMTKVIEALNGKKNALLQSPTGTGKTLCLLCATLGWLNKYREDTVKTAGNMEKYRQVKIFYSTRTHSQIKQVVKELKQTCYRPITSILGSRSQLCVRSDFSTLTGFQLNAACKAARTTNITGQRCGYYDNLMRNKNTILNQHKNTINDIEDLTILAKKGRFCPYFLERELKARADLIFLPYNYLLDTQIRDTMEINIENSIVIFDEAHNVETNAEDGSSLSLALKELQNCEFDLKLLRQKMRGTEECKTTEHILESLAYPISSLAQNMSDLKEKFEADLKPPPGRHGNEDSNNKKGKICEGRDIFLIFKGMMHRKSTQQDIEGLDVEFKSGIDATNFQKFIDFLKIAADDLSNVPSNKGGLESLHSCCVKIFELLQIDLQTQREGTNSDWSKNFIESYKLYIHFDDDYQNFSFSLWCLNPGVAFSLMKKKQTPQNIILTSGTLTPFKSFETELMLDFPIQLINNHVIDTKHQCYTVVLRKGPANYPLNFSYSTRGDTSVYNEMGTTLINIARLVPNGILVCFASYTLMNKCFEIWQSKEQRILARLEEIKRIYREPRKGDQLKTIMSEYSKDAKTKGAILACVCKGKVSEGIDFTDEMARAVVIVGVPFAPVADVKVEYKKKFLDENQGKSKRLTGNEWYTQQAIRACNQAIGRVIRHVNDYGVVFLCDDRYSGNQFKNEFPNWIKENLEITDKFGFMVGKVATFFKDRNKPAALNRILSKTKAPETTPIVAPVITPVNNNIDPTPFEEKRNFKNISVPDKSSEDRGPYNQRSLNLLQKPIYQNAPQNLQENKQAFSSLLDSDDDDLVSYGDGDRDSELRSLVSRYVPKKVKTEESNREPSIFSTRIIAPKGNHVQEQPANKTAANASTQEVSFMDIIENRPLNSKPASAKLNQTSLKFNVPSTPNQAHGINTPTTANTTETKSFKDILLGRTEALRKSNGNESAQMGIKRIKVNYDEPFIPATPPIETHSAPIPVKEPVKEESMTAFKSAFQMMKPKPAPAPVIQQTPAPVVQQTPETPMEDDIEDLEEKEDFVAIMTKPNLKPSTKSTKFPEVKGAIRALLSLTSSSESPESVEPSLETTEHVHETIPESIEEKERSKPEKMEEEKKPDEEGLGGSGNIGALCIMCYERKSEGIMASTCGHLACKTCWDNWLSLKSECPTCKSKVRKKHLIKIHF